MPCKIPGAKATLQQLPSQALNSLISLSNSAIGQLSAVNTIKQRIINDIDIQLSPLLKKQSTINSQIGDLQTATQIIPASLIAQCAPLGEINTSLQVALLGPIENALNTSFDISRLTSVKTMVNLEISEINAATTFFQSIIDCAIEALAAGAA